MVKYAALISLGCGVVMTGLVRIPFYRELPAYSRFSLDPAEMERTAKTLDDRLRARAYFMAIQDGIVERLLRRELSLTQACDQIYQNARTIYPPFLRFLGRDVRSTLKERMARNLVESLRLDMEENHSGLERADHLERDLFAKTFRAWCRQPWPEENRYLSSRTRAPVSGTH